MHHLPDFKSTVINYLQQVFTGNKHIEVQNTLQPVVIFYYGNYFYGYINKFQGSIF